MVLLTPSAGLRTADSEEDPRQNDTHALESDSGPYGASITPQRVISRPAKMGTFNDQKRGENHDHAQELPGRDPSGAMKTVAAFANGVGGTLLFGVEDDGRIAGLGEAYTAASRDRLTNLIRDWVHPLPAFHLEMIDAANSGVIAVNVAPGSDTPYGIATSERGASYFVRRAGTTFPASPADVRAFVQARLASPETLRFPGRRR